MAAFVGELAIIACSQLASHKAHFFQCRAVAEWIFLNMERNVVGDWVVLALEADMAFARVYKHFSFPFLCLLHSIHSQNNFHVLCASRIAYLDLNTPQKPSAPQLGQTKAHQLTIDCLVPVQFHQAYRRSSINMSSCSCKEGTNFDTCRICAGSQRYTLLTPLPRDLLVLRNGR